MKEGLHRQRMRMLFAECVATSHSSLYRQTQLGALKKDGEGAGETVQWVRALSARAEGLGSVAGASHRMGTGHTCSVHTRRQCTDTHEGDKPVSVKEAPTPSWTAHFGEPPVWSCGLTVHCLRGSVVVGSHLGRRKLRLREAKRVAQGHIASVE